MKGFPPGVPEPDLPEEGFATVQNRAYAKWLDKMRTQVQRSRETMTKKEFAEFLATGFRDEDQPVGYKWIPKLIRDEILKEPDPVWGIGLPEIMRGKKWEFDYYNQTPLEKEMAKLRDTTDADRVIEVMEEGRPDDEGLRAERNEDLAKEDGFSRPRPSNSGLMMGLAEISMEALRLKTQVNRKDRVIKIHEKKNRILRELLKGTLVSLDALSQIGEEQKLRTVIDHNDFPWGLVMRTDTARKATRDIAETDLEPIKDDANKKRATDLQDRDEQIAIAKAWAKKTARYIREWGRVNKEWL